MRILRFPVRNARQFGKVLQEGHKSVLSNGTILVVQNVPFPITDEARSLLLVEIVAVEVRLPFFATAQYIQNGPSNIHRVRHIDWKLVPTVTMIESPGVTCSMTIEGD